MKTILIVDDSTFMRRFLKKILETVVDAQIIEAENGSQAIMMYKYYSPELVLLDIVMPGLNGMDALERIMEMDQRAKVVMCTSLGGQQAFIIEALQRGAKDFIVKPYFDHLVPIVNKYLSEEALTYSYV